MAVVYKGSPTVRQQLQLNLRAQNFQVLLTTFEYIIKDKPFLSKIKWVLHPFLLRRLKKDIESEPPDKIEKVIKCKTSALQSQLYMQFKKHGMLFTEIKNPKGKQSGIKELNNTVMQLRKICQHPSVFPEVEDTINPSKEFNASLYRASGKVALLDRICEGCTC
ncbi:hypothetical protein FS749_015686 [Ceratobasidium sp. UAMH 11750]|nr:hypothetical protein FS749_015686 [Ceratobasidium sp. UAMH 11750]